MPYGSGHIRVLLIEDNPDHAELILRQLEIGSERRIVSKWCGRLDAGLNELEMASYDVILVDMGLPDSEISDTVRRTVAAAPTTPIVVLTSLGEAEMGLKAVQDGAQDYLVKAQMSPEVLLRALRYAIERKRALLDIERYARELERSNRDLEHFARVVSHDLKSPLAVLQMDLVMLKEKLVSSVESAEEYLRSANDQADQMAELIDKILELAKVQRSTAELMRVDAQAAFDRAIDNLRVEIENTSAIVTHDQLPMVWGDTTLLMQLFQNLISNAIRYRSAAQPLIHVSAELYDHEWVFSVEDNGIGVEPADRERVFGMFERAGDKSRGGTGIGLATCKRIVQRHNGRIWVDENTPQGSVFFFTMPLAENPTRASRDSLAD
ncbi:MAG: ATP-binding protein [Phycisphaerae bacterium]|nr:ATP-binding protein [Phycisphaerae bacterium]